MFNQISLTFLFVAFLHQSATAFSIHRTTKVLISQQIVPKNKGSSPTAWRLNAVSPNEKNDRKTAKNIFFGFTDKAEVLNGRIAMVFFSIGIYEEFVTGKSILEQAGFTDHNQQISGLEVAAFFGTLSLLPSFREWGLKFTSDSKSPDRI